MSPAVPSCSFVSHRRHPSRLPFSALGEALTGPAAMPEWQEGLAGCVGKVHGCAAFHGPVPPIFISERRPRGGSLRSPPSGSFFD